jgi:6-phosphogluconolactonase (cycloisomerase 2 family)
LPIFDPGRDVKVELVSQENIAITRRTVLGAGLVAAASLVVPRSARSQTAEVRTARYAYVGCRTTKERNARGEGIGVYRVDSATGEWKPVQTLKDLVNPSFLALDKSQRFLYAVHGDMSEISAFSVSPETGEIAFINRQSTEGKNPAHLLVDDSNRFVLVANYATGSVAVLPRNPGGSLGAVRHLEQLPGTPGPNKVDQTFSHPHEVVYDPKREFVLIPDKGLDRIFSFRFNATSGKLTSGPTPFVQVRPGAGPRHIAFHPTAPLTYVAHELDSSVGAYRYDGAKGALTPFQIVPSIPDAFVGANTAAEIEMSRSGRFVYVSNRGSDTVGVFAIDAATGRLSPAAWIPSEGKGPRFFVSDPSGRWLYVANENSDTIVPFQLGTDGGSPRLSGQAIHTGSPVCIVFSS